MLDQCVLGLFGRVELCNYEPPIFWPPDMKNWVIGKDPDAGKDWRWEEKGKTEDEMVGWHHWLHGHEFEQAPGFGDRQGGLVCCSPWGHKESDWATELNWVHSRLLCPWDFSQQEYWNELPCPPPGDLPDSEIKLASLMFPALTGRFFATSIICETLLVVYQLFCRISVLNKNTWFFIFLKWQDSKKTGGSLPTIYTYIKSLHCTL